MLPGSFSATFIAGTVREITDDGQGNLSGTGGTGTIAYASGEVVMVLSATPSGGIAYSWDRGAVDSGALAVSSDGSGMATFTIPGAPFKPGSVRVDWMTTRRQAAPAVNWSVIEAGNVLPVYDGYRDIANVANDNGNGGWQGGRAGTINYTTGQVTLQVAALYDYVEYTYSNRSKGLNIAPRATEPVLVTTNVQMRESFGGTITHLAQADSVSTDPQSASQPQPGITVELLPGVAEPIVPGSLLFSWNGSTYCDRSGILYRDVASNTNGGHGGWHRQLCRPHGNAQQLRRQRLRCCERAGLPDGGCGFQRDRCHLTHARCASTCRQHAGDRKYAPIPPRW